MKQLVKLGLLSMLGLGLSACGDSAPKGIQPQQMADALHMVMESDRTVYTRMIVNRLAVEEKVIKASEHWKEWWRKKVPISAIHCCRCGR